MADWTGFDFVDTFETNLKARASLTALSPAPKVFSWRPGEQEWTTDMIIVGHEFSDREDQEHIGPPASAVHDETVDVQGRIVVVRPDGADAVDTARTRATVLVEEVEQELRDNTPSVGVQTVWARITSHQVEQFVVPTEAGAARVCEVEFTITYKARTA